MHADLHLHSTCSDGTDTPLALAALAKKHFVSVISITDHDSVEAYRTLDLKSSGDVRVITGTEISTVSNRTYLRILGYYINTSCHELNAYIDKASRDKTENTRVNFENAVNKGAFQYDWGYVVALAQNQPRISGVHVVHALEQDDVSANGLRLWDMFHKYFWAESPDFIATETLTAYDAIDVVKKSGGIPVVAHPKSAKMTRLSWI